MIFGRIIFRSVVDELLDNLKRVENSINDHFVTKSDIKKILEKINKIRERLIEIDKRTIQIES